MAKEGVAQHRACELDSSIVSGAIVAQMVSWGQREPRLELELERLNVVMLMQVRTPQDWAKQAVQRKQVTRAQQLVRKQRDLWRQPQRP
jgi:hypothetical protein